MPEIYPAQGKISRLDILEYCWIQKDMGVDILELDAGLVRKIGKLPGGLNFIMRINNEEDLSLCISTGIKSCVLRKPLLAQPGIAALIRGNRLVATLEVTVNSLKGIDRLEQIKGLNYQDTAGCLRITGLSRMALPDWVDSVKRIKELLGIKIDICPGNRLGLGTATALEAVESGFEYVTATFAGYGRKSSHASLEELLAAMKVLLGKLTASNLSKMPEISSKFSRYTQGTIPDNKAIIGKSIFKYESGIHAGGIEKDPSTYEPFDPAVVGRQRIMAIGKHSGRSSVRKKLGELGIDVHGSNLSGILDRIREASIKKGSSLSDDELACLVRNSIESLRQIP